MAVRLPSRKTSALIFVGIVVTYLLFGWLALPSILQSQSEKFIAEKTGCRLTMSRPQFNPFNLSFRLSGLRLVQGDGKPLLAFRELEVDVSFASIFRGAFIFDGIRLDGLEATATLLPQGRLNWSDLIDSLKNKDKTSDSSMPRLDIHRLVLSDAKLDFADKRTTNSFATRIEPVNLELKDISSLSNDKGQYTIAASTAFGANVALHGRVSLEPLALIGNFIVENVDLSRLPANFRESLPVDLTKGLAGVSADYRLGYAKGQLEFNLEHLAAKLVDLKLQKDRKPGPAVTVGAIELKEGRFDLTKNHFAFGTLSVTGSQFGLQRSSDDKLKAMELGSLVVEDARFDLTAHQAMLGHIALKDGRVRATRNERSHIDLIDALQSVFPAAQPKQPEQPKQENAKAAADTGWRYRIEKIDLAGFIGAFRDETVTPAAELAVEELSLSMDGISEDQKAPIPLRASFKSKNGGVFNAEGQVIPSGPVADIRVKLSDLSLKPVQPYLNTVAKLKLDNGRLSTEGRVSYDVKGTHYRGSFALRDVHLTESDTGNVFLSWTSFGSKAIEVAPTKLNIGELAIDGIDAQLLINKDRSSNISRILRKKEALSEPVPASTAAAHPTQPTQPAKPYLLNIDRLRITHGQMDFADYSLSLPFGTRIHHLNGVVIGLTSRPGAPGQIELAGQVDEYGLAQAAGKIDLFNPTDFMDFKVVFRNVEMNRLTPYSATFAGRKIASGKLSLTLEYKIKQRQLQGENQVIMDQLTLGEKIDSPDAKDLPLDLAVAILQDSDGRIDLGLPVSGDMSDPQFSYGSIIWKAFTTVLTKIATAPFRALGALLGSGEKFESIVFDAGNARLSPPEREKLVRLAGALVKRPGLSLTIHGVYADTDRVALQSLQLRRAVAEKTGVDLEGKRDPGPMSTSQPKVQAALESLFSERFGSPELAAIKEGFRKANPGQLEQSAAGKMMSKLAGVLHEKRSLNEQEVTQLKGVDFYAVLFDRLQNKVVVDDESLLALAKTRGEFAVKALNEAGVPVDRLNVLAAEKVAEENGGVPVKMILGAVAKLAASTVPSAAAK